MSPVSFRMLKARERTELLGYVSPWIAALRLALFAGAAIAVAALLYTLETRFLPLTDPPLLWLVFTGLLMAFVYRRSRKWTGGREFRKQVRKDLDGGMARRLHVTVAKAIEFAGAGRAGPTFVVTTSKGQALLFSGRDFVRRKAKGFPWMEFEVCDAPNSGVVFKITRLAEPFPNVVRRPALSREQSKALGSLEREFLVLAPGWERLVS